MKSGGTRMDFAGYMGFALRVWDLGFRGLLRV